MVKKLNSKRSYNIRSFTEADKGYSRSVYKVLDQAFKDDDGKAELVYISDSVDMWLFNTKKLYDEIWNNRRKATSIAYEALIDLFQDTVDGYDVKVRVTSEIVKQWFKKNGLSYIEALKPVVDKIEEERAEKKAEKKESIKHIGYVKDEVFPYESNCSLINSYRKRLREDIVDSSTYNKIKNKALDFIKNSNNKSVTLCSLSDKYSLDEVGEIFHKLVEDEDVTQALIDYEYVGKLHIGSNRYAQSIPTLKMLKVRSKRGRSGWSDWTTPSIRVSESLDFDIRNNLAHDLYNAVENVMFKYKNHDITEDEFDSIMEEVSMRFCEDPGLS